MKLINSGLLLVAATALSCVSPAPSFSSEASKPSDVARGASTLEGRTVSISGYLVLEDEAHALWDSKDDADEVVRRRASGGDPIWGRCIAIYFDRKTARSVTVPTKGNVEVTGTVGVTNREKDGVDLWACNDVYIAAHRLVRK